MLEEVFAQTLGIAREEEVLVVGDSSSHGIAETVFKAVSRLTREPLLLEMLTRDNHGEEPPSAVAGAMRASDVVVAPTSKSLSHTEARKEACRAGARVATLPGVTRDMLTSGAMTADYREIGRLSACLAEKLTSASEVKVFTSRGTDFQASIEGRKGLADDGNLTEKGAFGNLPAGEAFVAPVEGTARGRVIFDVSLGGRGRLSQPVVVEVEDGRAVRVSDRRLESLLEGVENSRVVAEVGIGCNPRAKARGHVLEDEKAFHTAHIALGGNHTFGGGNTAAIHLDGVLEKPAVWLDREKIMEEGEFLCCL